VYNDLDDDVDLMNFFKDALARREQLEEDEEEERRSLQ
jgi:hypothetical protein